MFLAVDWPCLPREGESVEILKHLETPLIESVGYGMHGAPLVHLGRVVLDDLQVTQLRRVGWRVEGLPGAPV